MSNKEMQTDLEKQVMEKLKSIIDPHTKINVYDMGLISNIKAEKDIVALTFTPSSPFCPLGIQLAMWIKKGLMSIDGIDNVDINIEGHVQAKQINEMLKKM